MRYYKDKLKRELKVIDHDEITVVRAKKEDVFSDYLMSQLYDIVNNEETKKLLGSEFYDYIDFRLGWFYERLFSIESMFYYIVEDRKIKGYFEIRENTSEKFKGEVTIAFAVHSDYRRQGIAERGFTLIDMRLAKMGINKLYAKVKEINEPSLRFMKKVGFEEVDSEEIYYSQYDDTIKRMWLKRR